RTGACIGGTRPGRGAGGVEIGLSLIGVKTWKTEYIMKKIALLVLLSTLFFSYTEAQVHTTFEMRYITSDSKADGETDFTGESEWMSLDQRIDFLNKYAAFASGFYGNLGLDKPLIGDGDIRQTVRRIKPQPLTNVRQTLRLA